MYIYNFNKTLFYFLFKFSQHTEKYRKYKYRKYMHNIYHKVIKLKMNKILLNAKTRNLNLSQRRKIIIEHCVYSANRTATIIL